MNKLQIIEEIFGAEYTPYAITTISPFCDDGYFYRAKPKRERTWMTMTALLEVIEKANKHNVRIGVCFGENCFDVYFGI
jgi:hypothetical protein